MDIFEKCAKATEHVSGLKESGCYFFFRKLESPQDSEVVVDGKRVIMIGSNNYLGLTNHPRVKEAALKALMLKLPGIPHAGAPVGPDESFNEVIRTEGQPPEFDFESLDHVALIEKNDWADLSRIVQVSGSRTYCLKGRLAILEMKLAVLNHQLVNSDAARETVSFVGSMQ